MAIPERPSIRQLLKVDAIVTELCMTGDYTPAGAREVVDLAINAADKAMESLYLATDVMRHDASKLQATIMALQFVTNASLNETALMLAVIEKAGGNIIGEHEDRVSH